MKIKDERSIELTINIKLSHMQLNEPVVELVKLANEIQKEYNVNCTLNVSA